MNLAHHHFARHRIALIIAVVIASMHPIAAQPGSDDRWERIDIDVSSPLPSAWFTFVEEIDEVRFVSDRHFVIVGVHPAGGFGPSHMGSSDGGLTWTSGSPGDPLPLRRFAPSLIVASNGSTSDDDGATWTRIDIGGGDSVVASDAASADRMAVLYVDGTYAGLRLAITVNGGRDWLRADTLENTGGIRLSSRTHFGDAPPGDAGFAPGWESLRFVDTSTLVVGATVGARRFVTVVDLRTGGGRWHPRPELVGRIGFASRDVAYAARQRVDSAMGMTIVRELLRTTDGAATWQTVVATRTGSGPEVGYTVGWPDIAGVQALSPAHLVTTNAESRDSGITWTRWAHPFGLATSDFGLGPTGSGTFARLFALDSMRRFVIGPFGLLARTDDAGASWQRSAASANASALAAHGDRVVVARDFRSLAFSSDAGRTWRDAGLEGGLPAGLRVIHSMTWPDTADPLRLYGVADFAPTDGGRHQAAVTSSDGGATWQELGRIDDPYGHLADARLHGRTMPVEILSAEEPGSERRLLLVANATGLSVSEDGGATWSRRGPRMAITAIAIAPDGVAGIASVLDGELPWRQHVMVTSDGGSTWRRIDDRAVDTTVTKIVVEAPGGARLRYHALTSTVRAEWRTTVSDDGGTTWRTAVSSIGAREYLGFVGAHTAGGATYRVLDEATIDRAAAGTAGFLRLRTGATGETGAHSITATSVQHDQLYVAASSNVVGRWRIAGGSTGVATEAFRAPGAIVTDGRVIVRVEAGTRSGELRIVDALGRLVDTCRVAPGEREVTLDVSRLRRGVYWVGTGAQATSRFVVVR